MASLIELRDELPAKYTMSNKNIIFIAHVRDETVYFFDHLGETTTLVLLAMPPCPDMKSIFLNFMNDFGTTVIDIGEPETFDPNYKLSPKTTQIITKLLSNNSYERIMTHPLYSKNSDPQNNALHVLISSIIKQNCTNNHYTYTLSDKYTLQQPKQKIHLLKLYSELCHDDENNTHHTTLKKYMSITMRISNKLCTIRSNNEN